MKNIIKFEILIAVVITISLVIIMGWSIWFDSNNPQTGQQYIASLEGHGKFEANASDEVVFLGDSIVAREDWNVLFGVSYIMNAGVSGNTTDDVIVRLNSLIGPKPKKIFLMVGINDLLRGENIPYILANYETILSIIKLESPNTLVYIQSVLPINNDISEYGTVDSQEIIALNDQLKSLAVRNNEFFINLYPYFCGSDNKMYIEYSRDGLHPNSYGYAVWKSLVGQYVK